MDCSTKLNKLRARVEAGLDLWLAPAAAVPTRLHAAMRYSVEAGGKRVRPTLLLLAAELYPPGPDPLAAAVAVECIHTYSLIHDDLPAMDDDDLRRGKPTCHKQFDEATAILAGDALLAAAFEILADGYASTPSLAVDLVRDLARAAGSRSLVGGQMEDLLAERDSRGDESRLDFIQKNKTGALLAAALRMGGRIGGGSDVDIDRLGQLGISLGRAFQTVDDLLDETGDAAVLGKTPGKDAKTGKLTSVRILGAENARTSADAATREALALCRELPGDTSALEQIIRDLLMRSN